MAAAMEAAPGKTEELKRGNALNILRKYIGLPQKFRDIMELGKGTGRTPRPEPPFPME